MGTVLGSGGGIYQVEAIDYCLRERTLPCALGFSFSGSSGWPQQKNIVINCLDFDLNGRPPAQNTGRRTQTAHEQARIHQRRKGHRSGQGRPHGRSPIIEVPFETHRLKVDLTKYTDEYAFTFDGVYDEHINNVQVASS